MFIKCKQKVCIYFHSKKLKFRHFNLGLYFVVGESGVIRCKHGLACIISYSLFQKRKTFVLYLLFFFFQRYKLKLIMDNIIGNETRFQSLLVYVSREIMFSYFQLKLVTTENHFTRDINMIQNE